jgi:flagellar hook assembly protein FlgD
MVELNIYNSLGQEVRSLIDNEFTAGTYQVKWNGLDDSGREAPAGVYFYKIQAGNFQATNKMLLLK